MTSSPSAAYLAVILLWLTGAVSKALPVNEYTENYGLNETQYAQEDGNATNNFNDYILISNINGNYNGNNSIANIDNDVVAPVNPLMRVAFIALVLHILVVGGGFIIYTCVNRRHRKAKCRTLEIGKRLESPLTLTHLPDTFNCRCHGCLVARQIKSGLIAESLNINHL